MDEALQTDDIDALRRLAAEAWRRAETLAEDKALALQDKALALQDKALALQDKALALQQKDAAVAKLSALTTENEVLLQQIADLTIQLANATHRDTQLALDLQLRTLRRALQQNADDTYGAKSERRGRPEEAPKKRVKPQKKQRGHGPSKQPKLPVVPQVHTLDHDCRCDRCDSDLRVLGDCFEESELIASVRRSFVLKQVKRTKYACTQCGDIRTAPGPLKLVPGGRYDLSFTVQVAIDKYLDALPLERQVRRMQRAGLRVTSQALWDQLFALYVVLLPSWLALHDQVLAEPLLHADETPWRMMGRGKSKKWWLWTLASTAGVFFELHL